MTPTIEEVKKVAKECGAAKLGEQTYFTGREWADCVRLVFDGDALQAFAQNYKEEGWKSCAESYEKKLADKDAEITALYEQMAGASL